MTLDVERATVETLQVGELGDRLVEVHESIIDLRIDLSADLVSQLTFTVSDPTLKMHNNNYFMIGRTVTYGSYKFEIAAVDVRLGRSATVQVTARSQATQKLRREKGQKNFGAISPSTFAADAAKRVGLTFFGQDSPADGQIIRTQKDNTDESTFDVLKRLANANDFRFFEANGTMFFASEGYIVENQGKFEIDLTDAGKGTDPTDPFFPAGGSVRRSADGEKAATCSLQLLPSRSAFSVYPGSSFTVKGLSNFTAPFMVDRVEFAAGKSNLVRISATAVEDSPDTNCTAQTFSQGIRDSECVKRIQQAIGTKADGWWGPATQRLVLAFQKANNLPQDGLWNADDWAKIEGDYVRPNKSFGNSYTNPTGALVGIPKIKDVWYADKKVSTSNGWRYVIQNGQLPLPYPWNNGVWNPYEDAGYEKVVAAMNMWIRYLNGPRLDIDSLSAL
jgi:peptidoglycan hydrolase-like protein with peptidoglycan-binding domain